MPFREVFAVLFFVSVGMLVDPAALIANAGQVLALTALIVVGKALFTLLLGLFLPASGRTMLVVAVGLSQIGEFSFIVGQSGLSLGVLTRDQYGLILASALLSIVINPLLFKGMPWIERLLQRLPAFWRALDRAGPAPELRTHSMADHVVLVGYGQVGTHIVDVLHQLAVPLLIVERDAGRAVEVQQRGAATLFGDAANSEVLTHAALTRARALVVTVPDETSAELIVAAARDLAPSLPIIARAATSAGVLRVAELGARDVIHPELEGGLEIVRYTLQALEFPIAQVQQYIDAVRRDAYNTAITTKEERRLLDQLLATAPGMEVVWRTVTAESSLVGQTMIQANLRARTGASVVALVRDHQVLANPKSNIVFAAGDMIGLIGDAEQVAAVERIIDPPAGSIGALAVPEVAPEPTAV
jgi:CPA2 family monovalent cation:H+ antiporter-2